MGWSKLAVGCAVAAPGFALALAACGGASASSGADADPQAGASATGGAGAAGRASSGGTAGDGAGQSGGGAASGGVAAGSGGVAAGSDAAGESAAGTPNGPANVYVAELRGREGCLPRALPVVLTASDGFEAGQVRCSLTEAVVPAAGAACACDATQHLVPTARTVDAAVRKVAQNSGYCGAANGPSCASLCLCDLPQSSGAALTQCQTDATPIAELAPGFCYVDATLLQPLGNAALVSTCPADSRRELRILGPVPNPAPTLFLGCSGQTL